MSKNFQLLICICLFFITIDSKANDSLYNYKVILDVEDYNDDMSQDTLIGFGNNPIKFFPSMIIWGEDSTIHIDPLLYPKVDTTRFIYPNWEKLRINYMVSKFNQDTIIDMIFIISGKIPIDTNTYKDTAVTILIFGQCGLDTIPEINLTYIAQQQIFPFKARHLTHGQDFVKCTLRGESHRSFYEMPKLYDELLPPPPGKHACVNCEHKFHISAKLFPIPTDNNINLLLTGLDKGKYLLRIVNLSGLTVHTQMINVDSDNQQYSIQPNNIATGVYLLMVEQEGITIYSQKFIISK
ncbi:MAG: T9SS type A sorting domain-containing protein [Desulfobulbaceae bacterium]|nr:T9SS type A sorting domain-containing protein [Desulfobulbaceae bacterium]